jgi:hypothetical protein
MELLATVEDSDIDELFEEGLTQGELIVRVRVALGTDNIPEGVFKMQAKRRQQRASAPKCRICDKKGDSTRHHFVNKWILKELDDYHLYWSDRSLNCIPVCMNCHQELHSRSGESSSIAPFLTENEKSFAQQAINALSEQRPRLLILIACGDDSVYEVRLIRDWQRGEFLDQERVSSFNVAELKQAESADKNS